MILLCAVASTVCSVNGGEQVFSSSFVFSGSSSGDFIMSQGAEVTSNPLNSIRSGNPGQHSIASFAVPLSPGVVIQQIAFEYSYTVGFGGAGTGEGSNFTVRAAGAKVFASPLYNDYPYSGSHPNYSKPVAIKVPTLSIKVPTGFQNIEFDFDNNDRNIQLLLPLTVNVTCTGGPCNAPPTPSPGLLFCARYHPIHDHNVYDPSGPLLDDDGVWHQWEDDGGWSHWTSRDLIHWNG
jgi:hypothetical protein